MEFEANNQSFGLGAVLCRGLPKAECLSKTKGIAKATYVIWSKYTKLLKFNADDTLYLGVRLSDFWLNHICNLKKIQKALI